MKREHDNLLLSQAALGSKDAFSRLYNKYWNSAHSQAFKYLKDDENAKDIVQDVFVNIWLRKENQIGNFASYLHIAIRNEALKRVVSKKNHHSLNGSDAVASEINVQADSTIRQKEFLRSYRRIVSALPPRRQVIFKLHYHQDLTTKMIALQLGLTTKTVQNQLGKAVEQLKTPMLRLLSLIFILFNGFSLI